MRLTDQETDALICELKPLPVQWERALRGRPKRGHSEGELRLKGSQGNNFVVYVRKSMTNPLNFSVILALASKDSSQLFRVRRYNGRHGQHTNRIEQNSFYGFHIHMATERYQDAGFSEDTYAEVTDRYASLEEAITCLISDCAFKMAGPTQLRFFGELGQ